MQSPAAAGFGEEAAWLPTSLDNSLRQACQWRAPGIASGRSGGGVQQHRCKQQLPCIAINTAITVTNRPARTPGPKPIVAPQHMGEVNKTERDSPENTEEPDITIQKRRKETKSDSYSQLDRVGKKKEQ